MAKITFYTDKSLIVGNQTNDEAFGPMTNAQGQKRYNLESRLEVSQDAPALAVTKGILFAAEDINNSSLVNIALKPLAASTAGLPVDYFIYRGIEKTSLVDSNGDIQLSDPSWNTDNILTIIKEDQDAINQQLGISGLATDEALGIGLSGLQNDTLLEGVMMNPNSDFHSVIVPSGCQIGKFKGNGFKAGIQIVLSHPTELLKLEDLQSSESIFTIDPLNVNTGDPEKEQLRTKFIFRNKSEEILRFVDIAAFYGNCRNQNISVDGQLNDDTFLSNFFNRNKLYFDLRDSHGFSFNHFFKFDDTLQIGQYTGSTNSDITYAPLNYYNGDWPILTANGISANDPNRNRLLLKIPLMVGMPENVNILTSFSGGITLRNRKKGESNVAINTKFFDGEIKLKESEPVKFNNYIFSDDSFGCNIFLSKVDHVGLDLDQNRSSLVLNDYFPLKIEVPFDTNNIEDGEYVVRVIPSLYGPIAQSNSSGRFIRSGIGIAYSKNIVTFFTLPEQVGYSMDKSGPFQALPVAGSGIYKEIITSSESTYDPQNQSLGFLNQILKKYGATGLKLAKDNFADPADGNTSKSFLHVKGRNEFSFSKILEEMNALTFSREEYVELLSTNNSGFTDSDFIEGHQLLLRGTDEVIQRHGLFSSHELSITNGVPKLIDDGTSSAVFLMDHENTPTLNGSAIKLMSASPIEIL